MLILQESRKKCIFLPKRVREPFTPYTVYGGANAPNMFKARFRWARKGFWSVRQMVEENWYKMLSGQVLIKKALMRHRHAELQRAAREKMADVKSPSSSDAVKRIQSGEF